jgi:type I restriction enzyme R subunit
MFGLPEATLLIIKACIARYSGIQWVKIYGSRAKGMYRPGSDIDLAFSAETDVSAALLDDLDNLQTPYFFDVLHYESLSDESVREHIDRVGKILYP